PGGIYLGSTDGIAERMKTLRIKDNEKEVNAALLKQNFESGPFGHGALFRKSVEKVLTAQQAAKYKPIAEVLQRGGLCLVDEKFRRHEIGSQLVEAAVSHHQACGT